MKSRVRIPTRDGLTLNAHLYEAPGDQPAPCIVSLTPYGADHLHDRGMLFATRGLHFLAVDVRGRGDSEGHFRPHIHDADDGHDVIEWIARRPGCTGHVGMYGGSYLGSAQWASATRGSPPLKTIVPTAAPYLGVDTPMRGNIAACYEVRWLTLVSGRVSQSKRFADDRMWRESFRRWFEAGRPFRELDRCVGEPSQSFQDNCEQPQLGSYWDAQNPTAEQYSRIDLPVLTITGAYDGDQLGALEHYRQHMCHGTRTARASHYLIIGPWNHTGCTLPSASFDGIEIAAAGVLDLYELHADWYAWIFLGGNKPAFLKDVVAYYVLGAERWRYTPTLEAVTARFEPLYLQSDGSSSDVFHAGSLGTLDRCGGEPDSYVYDPRDIGLAELESSLDEYCLTEQRLLLASRQTHLVYHTAPFAADLEISGFFKFVAWVGIDQPDTDFRVSVYEIDLRGGSVLLAHDQLRARYRESLREARLIQTRGPLRYEFNRFNFSSRLIAAGHRLRLVFGPINSIHVQKNYNSGGVVADESMADARTVTVRLFHDGAHPSALYAPIGQTQR